MPYSHGTFSAQGTEQALDLLGLNHAWLYDVLSLITHRSAKRPLTSPDHGVFVSFTSETNESIDELELRDQNPLLPSNRFPHCFNQMIFISNKYTCIWIVHKNKQDTIPCIQIYIHCVAVDKEPHRAHIGSHIWYMICYFCLKLICSQICVSLLLLKSIPLLFCFWLVSGSLITMSKTECVRWAQRCQYCQYRLWFFTREMDFRVNMWRNGVASVAIINQNWIQISRLLKWYLVNNVFGVAHNANCQMDNTYILLYSMYQ